MLLGDVGDDDPPPQAVNSVASVAPEAAWQAPAQNRRREMGECVSDIRMILVGASKLPRRQTRKIETTPKRAGFPPPTECWWSRSITDRGLRPVIS